MRQENIEIIQSLKELESAGDLIGCFDDIPIDVYHANDCPGYSSTIIKRIVEQSYNHWFVSKDSQTVELEFGSAFHCFVNEPHLFNDLFMVAPTSSRKTGEWREAKGSACGKTVITQEDFECLRVMADKLYSHPDIGPYLSSATFEHTYFSVDNKTGLLKKCRPDILSNGIIFDLKSTYNASVESFAAQMRKRLQRISSAYYLEIVSEVTACRHDDFRLVACEKLKPFEIKVVRVSEPSIQKAQVEIREGLSTIRRILDEGPSAWKGYQTGVTDVFI